VGSCRSYRLTQMTYPDGRVIPGIFGCLKHETRPSVVKGDDTKNVLLLTEPFPERNL
jgi:hypothetical protein